MDPRRQLYWDLVDFSAGHGLEVGPLHRAMVTRDEGDISYVDVTNRDALVAHYAGDANVPADSIPEIDFALIDSDGTTRSLVDAVNAGAPFDWVIASHVIEHVPDVIGWLDQIAEVVVDGGQLVLAVPDRRYCFDVHRPPTTVGQMVLAHDLGDTRPSIRAVYDYFTSVVDNDVKKLWRGELPELSHRLYDIPYANGHVDRTRAGEYVDCHVWLFTPDEFLTQMRELRVGGLSSWIVERLEPTPHDDLEFRVVMRRLPRDREPMNDQPDEIQADAALPAWLSNNRDREVRRLQRRVAALETRLETRHAKLVRLRKQVERQQQQLASGNGPGAGDSVAAQVLQAARRQAGRLRRSVRSLSTRRR